MVMINKIRINTNYYNNNFNQNDKNCATALNQSSYIINDNEPPTIKKSQIIFRKLTDEQIAQINKVKLLPENARFIHIYPQPNARTERYESCYLIQWHQKDQKEIGTRILPEGYEVKKDFLGFIKIEKI